jgi:hypothetical protein
MTFPRESSKPESKKVIKPICILIIMIRGAYRKVTELELIAS